jgi:hypothetical protein
MKGKAGGFRDGTEPLGGSEKNRLASDFPETRRCRRSYLSFQFNWIDKTPRN